MVRSGGAGDGQQSATGLSNKDRKICSTVIGGAYELSRHLRKKVEMLFAHLKRILRLDRLRLRGPNGAQFEFTFAAIAQNLRRLAKLTARAPPGRMSACVS
jgi:hypothetical protein